jgi:hypothetical protein
MASRLDQLARQANDQARYDQSDQYRRDTKFLREMDDFARSAAQFRRRVDEYRARPWNVDEELQKLVKDARDVQYRIRRARFADQRTRETWDRVVALLGRMTSDYRRSFSVADRNRWFRDDGYADDESWSGEYDDRSGYYGAGELSGLARDLDDRANRLVEAGRRSVPFGYGYGDALGRFAEQARDFRGRVDAGRLSQQQLQLIVRRLVEEAQQAQSDISRPGVSREMRSEWDGAMQTLQRIREAAAV